MSKPAAEIQDWLVARISTLANVPAQEIDVRGPFLRYGLDSVATITLVSDLESWLDYRFRENPLEDHKTIESLAQYLAAESARVNP
jgi:acyl carrier protein